MRSKLCVAVLCLAAACSKNAVAPEDTETVPVAAQAAFVLASVPTVTVMNPPGATGTVRATFYLNVQAGEAPVTIDASSLPVFGFAIYKNGESANPDVLSMTSCTIPMSGVVRNGTATTIPAHSQVSVEVDFVFETKLRSGTYLPTGNYAIGLEYVRFSSDNGVTFKLDASMSNSADWRTPKVVLP